jgi:opacity protein-like surface antigen
MKKTFIIICLMSSSLVTTIKAQELPPLHRLELGFRFMPTFSSFDMKTSDGGTIKGDVTLGYGAGIMMGVNFTNHVGVQGEVIYSSLSQKYKDQGLQREINVRYVNIPLLFSLNTGTSKPVNLRVVAGPQIGVNVGSSITGSGSTSDTLKTVFAVKKSDFGFAYGAGLGFALNSTRTIRLDLGFRGVYGFVNISNTNQTASTDSYYILDRAIVRTKSAYVGITFLL